MNILKEGRSLSVFDFDDTLAWTDSWVYVKSKKGEYKLDSLTCLLALVGSGLDLKRVDMNVSEAVR